MWLVLLKDAFFYECLDPTVPRNFYNLGGDSTSAKARIHAPAFSPSLLGTVIVVHDRTKLLVVHVTAAPIAVVSACCTIPAIAAATSARSVPLVPCHTAFYIPELFIDIIDHTKLNHYENG
jgi:hypothetical protein